MVAPKRFKMKAPERKGSPLKYAHLANCLSSDIVYTAACIVEKAIAQDLVPADDPDLHKRIRMSYNKIRHARQFPETGDGLVRRYGQRPTVGFYGKRWQDAVDLRHFFSGRK